MATKNVVAVETVRIVWRRRSCCWSNEHLDWQDGIALACGWRSPAAFDSLVLVDEANAFSDSKKSCVN